jgi:hypothetical protein
MNINELFPSKYAQPEDLKGQTVRTTLNTVTLVSTRNPGRKMPELTCIGARRPIILQQSLANDIAKIHGPETDDWKGKKIMLYAEPFKDHQRFRARAVKPHEMPGYVAPANHRPVSAFTPNQTPDELEAEQLASDARRANIEAAGLTEAVKIAKAKGAQVA